MKIPSLFDLLSKLESCEYTQYKHMYVDLCDDLVAGILLSKIVYWFGKGKDGKSRVKSMHNGRICLVKMRIEWWKECRISERVYDRAMKKLQDLNFLTSEVHKSKFHDFQNACFIFINEPVLQEAITSYLKKEIDEESAVIPELPNGDSENSISPNGDSGNDETVISGNDETVIPYIPRTIPRSMSNYYIDLGQKTLACSAKNTKTLDVRKRWKLTDEQHDAFLWLKGQKIDAKDEKLIFWAKKYPFQRLIDVYNESVHNGATSLRQYMNKILEENKVVFNANIQANAEFAKGFSIANGWASFRILKKYVTFQIGPDKKEVDLNFDPATFMRVIIDNFEISQRYA